MPKVLINPAKYVQGPGELAKLGSYVTDYGSHALVLITPGGEKRFGAMIAESFAAAGAAAWVAVDWEPPHPVSRPKVTAVAQRTANNFFFIYISSCLFTLP